MDIQVIEPFGWRLPPDSVFWRRPVRPEEFQHNNFRNEFDYSTIFYDIFYSSCHKYAICICPPFFNLEPYLSSASFVASRYGKAPLPCVKTFVQQDRCTQIWLKLPSENCEIMTCRSGIGKFSTRIGKNYSNLFKGKKVLVTKQKNNPIDWIVDWINLNHAIHGINGVLIYDNNSTDYTHQELCQSIASRTNIETFCLVDWNYPFGVPGGKVFPEKTAASPWDSDFLNYSIPQAAHWRFLIAAEGVIWTDIDEIMLTEDGEDLFDKLKKHTTGLMLVSETKIGRVMQDGKRGWMDGDPSNSVFFHPPFQVLRRDTTKYIYRPESIEIGDQLGCHTIVKRLEGKLSMFENDILMRHYKKVNTNWKEQRNDEVEIFDPAQHFLDCKLVKAMEKACIKLPSYKFPTRKIIEYAKTIGACPRVGQDGADALHDDCSACPHR